MNECKCAICEEQKNTDALTVLLNPLLLRTISEFTCLRQFSAVSRPLRQANHDFAFHRFEFLPWLPEDDEEEAQAEEAEEEENEEEEEEEEDEGNEEGEENEDPNHVPSSDEEDKEDVYLTEEEGEEEVNVDWALVESRMKDVETQLLFDGSFSGSFGSVDLEILATLRFPQFAIYYGRDEAMKDESLVFKFAKTLYLNKLIAGDWMPKQFPALESLRLSDSSSSASSWGLFVNLKKLQIDDWAKLVERVSLPKLEELNIRSKYTAMDFSLLNCENLKKLIIYAPSLTGSWGALMKFPKLEIFQADLNACFEFRRDVENFVHTHLRRMSLKFYLPQRGKNEYLEAVVLQMELPKLDVFEICGSISSVYCSDSRYPSPRTLKFLGGGLELFPREMVTSSMLCLDLSGQQKLKEMSGLTRATQLKSLRLRDCKKIPSFEFLAVLSELEVLDLGGTKFSDLQLLGEMKKLRFLNLAKSRAKALSPLQSCVSLRELNISQTPVMSIRPLLHMPWLRELSMYKVKLARHGNVFKFPNHVLVRSEANDEGERHWWSREYRSDTSFFSNKQH